MQEKINRKTQILKVEEMVINNRFKNEDSIDLEKHSLLVSFSMDFCSSVFCFSLFKIVSHT